MIRWHEWRYKKIKTNTQRMICDDISKMIIYSNLKERKSKRKSEKCYLNYSKARWNMYHNMDDWNVKTCHVLSPSPYMHAQQLFFLFWIHHLVKVFYNISCNRHPLSQSKRKSCLLFSVSIKISIPFPMQRIFYAYQNVKFYNKTIRMVYTFGRMKNDAKSYTDASKSPRTVSKSNDFLIL